MKGIWRATENGCHEYVTADEAVHAVVRPRREYCGHLATIHHTEVACYYPTLESAKEEVETELQLLLEATASLRE